MTRAAALRGGAVSSAVDAAWLLLVLVLVTAAAVADSVVAPITPQAVLERQQQGDPQLFLLDVRTPQEYASGHVPGAVNIPHDQVAARLAEVPQDKDVVLYCKSGRRAALAADVLVGNGHARLQHLEGDMTDWVSQGRPVVTGTEPGAPPKP